MTVISGRMYSGMPLGTNTLRKCKPCFQNPAMITVRNTSSARATVTIR
jgi:hypothetical protein